MNEAELLKALQDAMRDSDGAEGATLLELREALNLSEERARKAMKRMLRAGQAECHKGRRPSMDGRMQVVPVYRLTPKKKR